MSDDVSCKRDNLGSRGTEVGFDESGSLSVMAIEVEWVMYDRWYGGWCDSWVVWWVV
jgi:hypothetical protein